MLSGPGFPECAAPRSHNLPEALDESESQLLLVISGSPIRTKAKDHARLVPDASTTEAGIVAVGRQNEPLQKNKGLECAQDNQKPEQ